MTDQTDSDLVTRESPEFDAERDIQEFERDILDADDLYDVHIEANEVGAVSLAARAEIERRNYLQYDTHRPIFTQRELLDIGMMLMTAKQRHAQQGETDRVARIDELAASFLDGFDVDADDMEDAVLDGMQQ